MSAFGMSMGLTKNIPALKQAAHKQTAALSPIPLSHQPSAHSLVKMRPAIQTQNGLVTFVHFAFFAQSLVTCKYFLVPTH